MTNRSKDKGTWVETQLVTYAQRAGFSNATRLPPAGAKDVGDVVLCRNPLIMVECKWAGASGVHLTEWMRETVVESERAGAMLGLLVVKQPSAGIRSVGRWLTACTVVHYSEVLAPVSGLIEPPYGEVVSPWRINGSRGFVTRVLDASTHELCPESWPETRGLGMGVGWRIPPSEKTTPMVAGPLWRFLRALRLAGMGDPLTMPL